MKYSGFKDRNWGRLLDEIDKGLVVPVIGPELLQVSIDGQECLLNEYLAKELARRLEIDVEKLARHLGIKEKERISISDVLWAYDDDPGDAYFEIADILKKQNFAIPEPLRMLAEIKPLKLFLSTTFDSLMARALNESRYKGASRTIIKSFRKPGPGEDIVAPIGPSPFVYHLFGQASTLPTYVLTEEDLLEWGHLWQDPDLRPRELKSYLHDKYLMMLGCSFPDWLARFVLCALKRDCLFASSRTKPTNRGMVADEHSRKRRELALFLSRCNAQIYDAGGGIEFVRELHKRWKEYDANRPAAPPQTEAPAAPAYEFKPGSIFISYASEDRQAASQLKAALEAYGIDAWYDDDALGAGSPFKHIISQNIKNSSLFIPIISTNVLTTKRRFLYVEWNQALDEKGYRTPNSPFLVPVAIDNTDEDESKFPPEFCEIHWVRLPGGVANDKFLAECKKKVRELHRKEGK